MRSRMAERERERRWQLTGTDSADGDAATPGAKGSSPCHVFTGSTAGTTVRSCHLHLYLGSLLPHCSQKLNQTPAKDGRALSLATRQALAKQAGGSQAPQSLWAQDNARKATRSSPAWAEWDITRSSSSSQGSRGAPILREGSAPQMLCGSGRTNTPIYGGGSRSDTGTEFTPQQSHPAGGARRERGDVISQMLPTAGSEAQWSILLIKSQPLDRVQRLDSPHISPTPCFCWVCTHIALQSLEHLPLSHKKKPRMTLCRESSLKIKTYQKFINQANTKH